MSSGENIVRIYTVRLAGDDRPVHCGVATAGVAHCQSLFPESNRGPLPYHGSALPLS